MTWHTPGPWHAGARGTSVTAPETEDALALNVRITGGNEKVNRANARLIAAAPDMLALLMESQESIGGDWRERRDAIVAKVLGRPA